MNVNLAWTWGGTWKCPFVWARLPIDTIERRASGSGILNTNHALCKLLLKVSRPKATKVDGHEPEDHAVGPVTELV